MATDRIKLQFDLDEHDMAAFYRTATEISPAVRRAWDNVRKQYRIAIGLAAGLLLLILVLGAIGIFRDGAPGGSPVLMVALVAGFVGSVWSANQHRRALAPVAQRGRAAQYAAGEAARYHLGPQTLEAGPDGVTLSTRHHDITQRWSGIAAIRESPDGIYIHRLDHHCFIVPKRIFTFGDDAKETVRVLRALLEASGCGEARRIRTHLASADVACPGCGYNLRGSEGSSCPECGREFDIGLIQ